MRSVERGWRSDVAGMVDFGVAVAVCISTVVGCSGLAEKNYRLTGETRIYQADQSLDAVAVVGYGALHLPHDVVVSGDSRSGGGFSPGGQRFEATSTIAPEFYHALDKNDPQEQRICIVLNRCFVKYLEELGKPEVLAYVEVEDGVGSEPIKNVFFKDDYQPAGALLNFQDAILYGPTTYAGKPITIRLYVYELDREDNKVAAAVVDAVAGTAKTFAGPYGLVADLIGDVIKTLIQTNVDDREFYHEVTLYPIRKGAKYPPGNVTALRTGTYVIVKKEVHRLSARAESVIEFKDELDVDLGLGGWPTILCRSGELYHHEKLADFYEALDGLTGREIDKTLRTYAAARKNAARGRGPAPERGAVDRELSAAVRRNAERARMSVTPEAVFLEDATRLADAKARTERVDFKQYLPYRAKSYLTFSVVNHLAPEDPQALNEIYTDSARQIEEVLNARLDTDELTRSILEVQQKASEAIVSVIAARKFNQVAPEDRGQLKAALIGMYPDQAAAIEYAYDRLLAQRQVDDLTDAETVKLKDLLTDRVSDLNEAGALDAEKLDALQDTIQRLAPDLWPTVEPIFESIRLMRELEAALGCESEGASGASAGESDVKSDTE